MIDAVRHCDVADESDRLPQRGQEHQVIEHAVTDLGTTVYRRHVLMLPPTFTSMQAPAAGSVALGEARVGEARLPRASAPSPVQASAAAMSSRAVL